jgi:chromosome segregation ATPase
VQEEKGDVVEELRAELQELRGVVAALQAEVSAKERGARELEEGQAAVKRELEGVHAAIKREAKARHRAAAMAVERQLVPRFRVLQAELAAYRAWMDGEVAALKSALRKMRCVYIERDRRDEAVREARALVDRAYARIKRARARRTEGGGRTAESYEEEYLQVDTLWLFAELGSAKFSGSAADVNKRFDGITAYVADFREREQRELDEMSFRCG